MTDEERFGKAVRRFDEVHASDPRRDACGEPLSVGYHRQLARWVERLAPDASEALRLAARCQHIRRWAVPRESFPAGLPGYKRWRSTLARRHADEAERVLAEVGYGEAVRARVRALLLKKGLKADAEVQRFEDAICLTFLERELAAFSEKQPSDKLADILHKTWRKMSPAGRRAAEGLLASLPPRLAALVARAAGAPER